MPYGKRRQKLWGANRPPSTFDAPPNPNGAPKRWFLVEYHHSWLDGELYVTLLTDVACHLWLYWTDIPMRMHTRSDFDSGVGWYWKPQYCFVQWEKVEQVEPGDVVLHHFSFPGWAFCQWRWWIFAGEIGGERSPSVSPIMNAHYQTFQEDESMRHLDLTDKEVAGIIDHADDSIPAVKLRYPFTFTAFPYTPSEAPTEDYHVANKKYVDDQAGGPAGLWDLIAAVKLPGSVNSYTFENIPTTYDMLRVTFRVVPSTNGYLACRINGRAGAIYRLQIHHAAGAVTAAWQNIDTTFWRIGAMTTSYRLSGVAIFDSSTTWYPGIHVYTGTGWEQVWHTSGLCRSAAEKIFAIQLYHESGVGNNLLAGSILTLEGFAIPA